MRKIIIGLAGLVAVKVWATDQIYRSATSDALITAYRPQAIEACRRQAIKGQKTRGATVPLDIWTKPSETKVVLGRSGIDVRVWEIEDPRWRERFRHPQVVITADDGAGTRECEYDMIAGTASLPAD